LGFKSFFRFLGFLPIVLLHYDRLLGAACCLSVCNAVHSDSGLVYAAKSCTTEFLAGMFLFVPSDTFSVGCIV